MWCRLRKFWKLILISNQSLCNNNLTWKMIFQAIISLMNHPHTDMKNEMVKICWIATAKMKIVARDVTGKKFFKIRNQFAPLSLAEYLRILKECCPPAEWMNSRESKGISICRPLEWKKRFNRFLSPKCVFPWNRISLLLSNTVCGTIFQHDALLTLCSSEGD